MSRLIAVFVVLCAAVALTVAASGPSAAVGDCTPQQSWGTVDRSAAQQVLSLVNQHRATRGLSQLTSSPSLTASAEWKSLHMSGYGYFAHDDPAPPVSRSVGQRLIACGYPSNAGWGENIAYGYTTPSAVMQGWLNSPGHRANIENASYRTIGIGVARNAAGRLYWTQDFGTSSAGSTPLPSPPSPPPTADTQAPSTPTGLVVTGATRTSISLRWNASGDNRGVSGYGVYVGGTRVGTVAGLTATISGRACGTSYGVGVDAYDAAGNRSGRALVTA
ncbi:MAG TPA: CAP domain-containing protein, partial [Gaiellaceae bacterium]|nr:CAP domain-containing protein [Gaiellaceae bacterium]